MPRGPRRRLPPQAPPSLAPEAPTPLAPAAPPPPAPAELLPPVNPFWRVKQKPTPPSARPPSVTGRAQPPALVDHPIYFSSSEESSVGDNYS